MIIVIGTIFNLALAGQRRGSWFAARTSSHVVFFFAFSGHALVGEIWTEEWCEVLSDLVTLLRTDLVSKIVGNPTHQTKIRLISAYQDP